MTYISGVSFKDDLGEKERLSMKTNNIVEVTLKKRAFLLDISLVFAVALILLKSNCIYIYLFM